MLPFAIVKLQDVAVCVISRFSVFVLQVIVPSAVNKITGGNHLKDEDGKTADYAYCDVWQFHNGKMAALNALVIKAG